MLLVGSVLPALHPQSSEVLSCMEDKLRGGHLKPSVHGARGHEMEERSGEALGGISVPAMLRGNSCLRAPSTRWPELASRWWGPQWGL